MNILNIIKNMVRSLRYRNMEYIESRWEAYDSYPTISYRGLVFPLWGDDLTAEQKARLLWAGAKLSAIREAVRVADSYHGQPNAFTLSTMIPDTYEESDNA